MHSGFADTVDTSSLYGINESYSSDNSLGHHVGIQEEDHVKKRRISDHSTVDNPKDHVTPKVPDVLTPPLPDRISSQLDDGLTYELPMTTLEMNRTAEGSDKSNDAMNFVTMRQKSIESTMTNRNGVTTVSISVENASWFQIMNFDAPLILVCELCSFQCYSKNSLTLHKREKHGMPRQSKKRKLKSIQNVSSMKVTPTMGALQTEKAEPVLCSLETVDDKNGHECPKRVRKGHKLCGPSIQGNSCSLGIGGEGHNTTQISDVHNKERTCLHCQRTFQTKTILRNHLQYCLSMKFYQCLHCNSTHSTKEYLIRHIRQSHLWIPCTICRTAFQSSVELEDHMATDHSAITHKIFKDVGVTWKHHAYICIDCQNIFPNRELMESHLLTKCKFSAIKCWRCNSTFKCKCSLLQHIQQIHSQKMMHLTHPLCPVCGQVFSTGHVLTQHIISVHFSSLVKPTGSSAQNADENNTLWSFASSEEKLHGTQSQFKCLGSDPEAVEKRTSHVSHVFRKYPSLSHSFRCRFKSFKPLKIWQEAKECPFCHKTFSKRHLQGHIRKKCQEGFIWKLMREHNYAKRTIGKVSNLERTTTDCLSADFSETARFKCSMCDMHFSLYASLLGHMGKVHTHIMKPASALQFQPTVETEKGEASPGQHRLFELPKGEQNNGGEYSKGLKRSSRCLMCGHWFHEIEAHLWTCQAKRPCLNKINEVYIEIKKEPDQFTEDNESLVSADVHP